MNNSGKFFTMENEIDCWDWHCIVLRFNQMYKLSVLKLQKVLVSFVIQKMLLEVVIPVNKMFMTVFSIRILECVPIDSSFTITANFSSNLTLFYVWCWEKTAIQVLITYIPVTIHRPLIYLTIDFFSAFLHIVENCRLLISHMSTAVACSDCIIMIQNFCKIVHISNRRNVLILY